MCTYRECISPGSGERIAAGFICCRGLKLPAYILQRVDALGRLLNLAADDLGDELGGELGEGAAGRLALDDVGHLAPDSPDLRRRRVRCLLDLIGSPLGEGNGEETNEVVIGGLDGDVGLNQGLPLAHKRSQLVGGEIEPVEVGEAVLALHLIHAKADLAERVVLILLQIGQRDLDDAALEGVVRVLQTGGTVDESLADTGFQH